MTNEARALRERLIDRCGYLRVSNGAYVIWFGSIAAMLAVGGAGALVLCEHGILALILIFVSLLLPSIGVALCRWLLDSEPWP